jgi:hypothetical protein
VPGAVPPGEDVRQRGALTTRRHRLRHLPQRLRQLWGPAAVAAGAQRQPQL